MNRVRNALRVLLPAAMAAAVAVPVAPAAQAAPAATVGAAARKITGKLADGTTYLIQVPSDWNGTLFLYSHGYVVPGESNPAYDAPDPVTGRWLLRHGYALAGSSYATTGWAIQQALPDQIKTLGVFDRKVGTPKQTIAWGASLGGMITAGLVQRYPRPFAAAVPLCGVLAGGVGVWNTALDSAFAFKTLIDPKVSVVDITDPVPNFKQAIRAVGKAQKTAAGRARIALAAALNDTPGWFTPLSPQPAATDYAAQEANQFQWDSQVDFPFVYAFRAELEARAGGNVSWTAGVDFYRQFSRSTDKAEVIALYKKAGLNLHKDLARLAAAPQIPKDHAAIAYLRKYITYNGHLTVPVLTMHTTGDGLVVPENEQAYRTVVDKAANGALLRQVFVSRAGHCAFTPADTITAARTMLRRLATGRWPSLTPAAMNARARALGPDYNIYPNSQHKVVPTPPMFTAYSPAPFLRTYFKG